ncbi:HAD-IA family hydrolase [Actinomadura graeca]|uniref:HAD-IA family hydrolase n=1 Tax=Actinomadura graeca TaxID=2750812 RepID=A0ABX8R623_9ACTN|nr:HAD-IA family hydrolase [Actinomadura graeca]QXJ25864.1 HAD-IA family hydrolase [Actinomadura graeca]
MMIKSSQTPDRLVIFDLDGVLVDAQGAESQALMRLGLGMGVELTDELADDLFSGKRLSTCIALLEELAGTSAPADAVDIVRSTCEQILRTTLRPIPGVEQVLACLSVHMCVASNSPRGIIHSRLEATGLAEYFGDCIYSAYDIGFWKPDPHLFLWAAETCGYPTDRCVVIEDSTVGVQASLSADIPVLRYSSPAQHAETDEVTSFCDMRHLPALLEAGPSHTLC